MRDHVLVHINGRLHEVRGPSAIAPLSEFLRNELRLTGTKIVCEEGDCGACTVLVGRLEGDELRYRSVNSCIHVVLQLDGCHVVTVEGLRPNPQLTAVQEAMVREQGAQCGFCTPGFVTAMHGFIEERAAFQGGGRIAARPADQEWREALTGNLCRCTGYEPILRACASINPEQVERVAEVYPSAPMVAAARRALSEPLELTVMRDGVEHAVHAPVTLPDACALRKQYPDARVIAGATDLGVQINKGRTDPARFLSLALIPELRKLAVDGGAIHVGAQVVWSDLERLCRTVAPEFARILAVFASPQIKNVGTLVGNVVNASPIADSLPFLFVTDTEVLLSGSSGNRAVNINAFYRGYKDLDMRPDELVVGVRIPLPDPGEIVRLYKVSRRRDLDISAFTAAIRLGRSGGVIAEPRVAYGGVGPVVLRLPETESFLAGRAFEEATFREAGRLARGEISPISDVRGSADFRLQLAENIMLRFYEEERVPEAAGAR